MTISPVRLCTVCGSPFGFLPYFDILPIAHSTSAG